MARDGMFALREVHPALKGQWIIAMREPLARGLACLRTSLEGCRFAVFDHVTEYDYDGVMTSIGQVAGFKDCAEAEAHAGQRCDEIVGSFQVEDRWKPQNIPPRPANILPATGSRILGTLPVQFAFSALRANEYESCYVRTYIVEAEPERLVDSLLSNNLFAEDFARLISKLGEQSPSHLSNPPNPSVSGPASSGAL